MFKIERPFRCISLTCCPNACNESCNQEITVLDKSGQHLSRVKMIPTSCFPCSEKWKLSIPDHKTGQQKYKLGNNLCKLQCCEKLSDCGCGDKYLYIYDNRGNKVGTVVKQWRGCLQESCTDADNLLITFPVDSWPEDKAAIIAAVLLSDYNVWENQEVYVS